ncbi:MAG: hypothetical protein ABI824_18325 [Acidobacteriota bacterium]
MQALQCLESGLLIHAAPFKVTHSTLVALGVRWLHRKCSVVLYEFATVADENPDVIGWAEGVSFLIECKVSRPDFLRDSQKPVRRNAASGMGHRRYYMCPAELIQPKEVPPNWGLLWVAQGHVTVKKESRGHPKRNVMAEVSFMSAMLRRAQIRIGTRPLSEWLRGENRFEAKRGQPPNASAVRSELNAKGKAAE